MGSCYRHLNADERNSIQRGLNEGLSCRRIAERLGRCPSAVSREISRSRLAGRYDGLRAGERAGSPCRRGRRKRVVGTALLREVHVGLLGGWSAEQIAGRLKTDAPR